MKITGNITFEVEFNGEADLMLQFLRERAHIDLDWSPIGIEVIQVIQTITLPDAHVDTVAGMHQDPEEN